jgi:hypothetical protein
MMNIYTEGCGHSETEVKKEEEGNDFLRDNATAAAALVAGNDCSSFARYLLYSSVLARALGVIAEVVRHLHRVHQRGAAAVLILYLFGKRTR